MLFHGVIGVICRLDEVHHFIREGKGSLLGFTEATCLDFAFLERCNLLIGDADTEVVHLKPGDVMIQRGTIHTWVNRGSVPAVIAFILIDAKPVEVDGKEMRTFFPVSDRSQGVEV
jgi:hypothetical protein